MKKFWTELNLVRCYKLWYLPKFMNLLNNSPPHAPGVLERDLWFHVQNSVKLGTFALPEPLQIQSTKQIRGCELTQLRGKVKVYWNSQQLELNSV